MSDGNIRQIAVGTTIVLPGVAISGRSAKPEPEVGGYDTTSDALMMTTCDWPLNVTWIFQYYNNVSEPQFLLINNNLIIII